ncbi:hypothetical protein OF83DRAFT_1176578 [Amylostereum chailletii]|nr:hypothetical protein OF83DRAFT_1176578 [Amylostereum chailletii]
MHEHAHRYNIRFQAFQLLRPASGVDPSRVDGHQDEVESALQHEKDWKLDQYRPLLPENLKTSTTLVNVNNVSSTPEKLAWFWDIDVEKQAERVFRVQWLTAWSTWEWAREDLVIFESEMHSTVRGFLFYATRWVELGKLRHWLGKERGATEKYSGHIYYALWQETEWLEMAERAKQAFKGPSILGPSRIGIEIPPHSVDEHFDHYA